MLTKAKMVWWTHSWPRRKSMVGAVWWSKECLFGRPPLCVACCFTPPIPPPPPVLWISRWAWFGFGAVGLSIACGTCPTDTVIDSVSATWRTERPGVWRGWQRGHGGAEKEGFLLSGWVKRTDKPKLDHLEPHECTWQERAFTFGMGDRNKDRVY